MYIGIDLGTSGVKAILLSEQGEVLATQTEKLQVSRPHPLWSEQDPEKWWEATDRAIKALGQQHSLRDVMKLFSALAAAEFTSLRRGSQAAFGVYCKIASASSRGLLRMRSITIETLRGLMRA